jgi:hypothetical protein
MHAWRHIMSQITLRQLPPNIERRIRRLANEGNMSLNKTIILLLKKSLGLTENENKQRNLENLSGNWDEQEVKEFESNMHVFNEVDDEVWES